ncbi:Hypothetical_protein [Hexamita inflata]|uniref:Hypothetical_protein n=1 Tax=Hexamita inflata TaxID=28002 RepID=A0AA86PWF0_9EUKA|nr:Hypothetical protein HINF_LOCUS33731 [Hexamita inflata]
MDECVVIPQFNYILEACAVIEQISLRTKCIAWRGRASKIPVSELKMSFPFRTLPNAEFNELLSILSRLAVDVFMFYTDHQQKIEYLAVKPNLIQTVRKSLFEFSLKKYSAWSEANNTNEPPFHVNFTIDPLQFRSAFYSEKNKSAFQYIPGLEVEPPKNNLFTQKVLIDYSKPPVLEKSQKSNTSLTIDRSVSSQIYQDIKKSFAAGEEGKTELRQAMKIRHIEQFRKMMNQYYKGAKVASVQDVLKRFKQIYREDLDVKLIPSENIKMVAGTISIDWIRILVDGKW